MKRAVILVLLLLIQPEIRAGWMELREGADANGVIAALGEPLIRSRSRSGTFESWTYDAGGYAVFVNARLSYWEASRPVATAADAARLETRTLGRTIARPVPPRPGMASRRGAPMR